MGRNLNELQQQLAELEGEINKLTFNRHWSLNHADTSEVNRIIKRRSNLHININQERQHQFNYEVRYEQAKREVLIEGGNKHDRHFSIVIQEIADKWKVDGQRLKRDYVFSF